MMPRAISTARPKAEATTTAITRRAALRGWGGTVVVEAAIASTAVSIEPRAASPAFLDRGEFRWKTLLVERGAAVSAVAVASKCSL